MTDGRANLRAAAFTASAMIAFGCSDAIIKLLSAAHPIGEIMFGRGVVICLLLWGYAAWRRERVGAALRDPVNLARAACELVLATCFFRALATLPIAEATALLFVFPVLLTTLAALVLRERVGWRRWAAVAVGFLGALVILRPGTAAWRPEALFPLAAAAALAVRDLVTRFLSVERGTASVALAAALLVTLGGLATASPQWSAPSAAGLLGFAAGGTIATLAFLAIVEGTRAGDVSFAAPFRYVGVPVAFLLGWLIWGQTPDLFVAAGAALVVTAGVALALREHALAARTRPA